MFHQKTVLLFLILLFVQVVDCRQTSVQSNQEEKPVPVIFDSDMATDVDDVGALATLHALEDRGEAKILAVGTSERNRWQPLFVDAINTYDGHGDIPMGRV